MVILLAGERAKGETARAVQACNDWLRLGPGRSLPRLAAEYAKVPQHAPTRSLVTLKAWSKRHGWARRAEEYDAALEAEKTRHAEGIMRSGLGLPHERVLKLKLLAEYLESEIQHERPPAEEDDVPGAELGAAVRPAGGGEPLRDRVWVRDVKQVGGGEDAQIVEIRRFNAALIEQYRGVLDDLARETGGRNPRLHVAVGGGDLADLLRQMREALPAAEADGGEAGPEA